MAKKKKLTNAEKHERQKTLTAERVRRFRQKMSEEEMEKKRQYDRDRYKDLKEKGVIKPVRELKKREQRVKRKNWKKYSRTYRIKQKNQKDVLTPPDSEDEAVEVRSSTQKERGRKQVRRDRSKAYKTIKKRDAKIKTLERTLKKVQKRLERERKKRLTAMGSPSPKSKVNKLIGKEKLSPAVKKRLFVGFALEKQLKSNIEKNVPKSKKQQIANKVLGSKLLRKYRVQSHLRGIISYKANRVLKESDGTYEYKRKKYNSKIVKEENRLKYYFEDDTVSRMCPGKKDVKRCGKSKKQKRILLDSMKNLYKRFIRETKSKISYTTFTRARPFWVVSPKAKDRDTCACKEHSNMELLVTALKTVGVIEERTPSEVLENMVCDKSNEMCMLEKCVLCRNKTVIFKPIEEINIKLFQWKTITEEKNIKGVLRKVKKTVKEKEITNLESVKRRFIEMLTSFKKHIFSLIHQSVFKKKTRENLKQNEIMFQIDFSENYNLKYAKEIQSMHFGASKQQISLHTGVRYHNENGTVKSKGFCTVSECLDHQSYGVWAHFEPILRETAQLFPATDTIHIFSDSPSSQYRNRWNVFLYKSLLPSFFPNLKNTTWNYSEPGHGKGPMDGIGGTLKRRADEYVLHGADITSAEDFVKMFEESKVMVLEVKRERVEAMKNFLQERSLLVKIKPIKHITKMKQITYSVSFKTMYGRSLSCKQCGENTQCLHYNIGLCLENDQPQKKEKKRKLDIYSSSEDELPKTKTRRLLKTKKRGESRQSDVPGSSKEAGQDDAKKKTHEITLRTGEDMLPKTKTRRESRQSDVSGSSKEAGQDDAKKKTPEITLKTGEFVLVRFESKKSTHQFVGICRSSAEDVEEGDEIIEPQVVFLKSFSKDKRIYMLDENDVSVISLNQIVATLPPPNLMQQGSRSFYKFKRPINTY